jgi:two-component system, OmpR family, sensor kinase
VRRIRTLTLRGRLLAALLALLALICLIFGGVTELALRQNLVNQVDHRLSGPAGGPFARDHGPAPSTNSPAQIVGRPGGGDGLLSAAITNGAVTGKFVTEGTPADTSSAVNKVLSTVPSDGKPVTRDLPGLGSYRLEAQADSSGVTYVTGLPLKDVNNTLLRLGITELGVGLAGLIGVGLIGRVVITRTLRPLRRVATTATRVSEMKLDQGEVALSVRVPDADTDARTEVGQVGAALNRMLGHVATALSARQASEVRVRQFVADASHELRTPLASIRGYAELTRRTGQPLPDDIRYAMSRIESEGARMTRLVEDLLLLARLDSGRPVEHGPVDITRLVLDAVSDATVAGRLHLWRLDLPDEPVTVTGDGQRLHQVIANLLANARTHTPPGTTVLLSLESEDDGATLRVSDNGPGIPKHLQPEVFERFARGDSSRARATGSTGLGLAIVEAVAHAHGGRVSVESEPGRTMFSVWLPADHKRVTAPEPQVAHSLDPLSV